LEGGSYFGGVRGLWELTDHEHGPKERAKKSVERIEESGGNVRGLCLSHDRKEWMAIEELKGAEHEWSFWEGSETEKD
jgi:hypothetical protein